VADEEAVRLLGGLDTALFHQLLAAILGGDPPGVAAAVRRVEDEGWDPRHVYAQFLAFCRDALHLGMGGDPAQVDLPGEEAAALAALARGAGGGGGGGYENLLRLLHQLLTSEPLVRRSDTGTLALEIAWLRAAELPKLTRVEEILAGSLPAAVAAPAARAAAPVVAPPAVRAAPAAPAPPARPPAAPRPAVATAPQPAPAAEPAPNVARFPSPPPPPQTAPPMAPASSAARSAGGRDAVGAFIDEVSRRKQHLAGYLEGAQLSFDEGCLSIAVDPDDRILKARLDNDTNRRIIDEAVAAVWGPGNRWRSTVGEARPSVLEPSPEEVAAQQGVADNAFVQTVLDIFKGRVVEANVEEQGSLRED
jgi:DNA polymerase III gamma/tau subunit